MKNGIVVALLFISGFVVKHFHFQSVTREKKEKVTSRSELKTRDADHTGSVYRGTIDRHIMLSSAESTEYLLDSFVKYSDDERKSVFAKIEKLPCHERLQAQSLFFSVWAQYDPEEALAFLDGGEIELYSYSALEIRGLIYSIWAQSAPLEAADNFKQSKEFNASQFNSDWNYSQYIFDAWVNENPYTLMDWIDGCGEKERKTLLPTYIASLYQLDADIASEQLSKLSANEQATAISGVAIEWAKSESWEDIEKKIASLPEDLYESATRSAFGHIALHHPVLAKDIIFTSNLDQSIKNHITRQKIKVL